MGLDKFSATSFEEMAEQADAAEVKNAPAAEPKAEVAPATDAVVTEAGDNTPADKVESPKAE
jgi:hypothetical protein